MTLKIDELKELLKNKQIVTPEDKEKADLLKVLFNDDQVFFKLNKDAAIGILEFLGIPEEQREEYYAQLISFEEYERGGIKL